LIIKFVVFEGKQYKVGSVQFKGNQKFTSEQIRRGMTVLGVLVRPRMLENSIFTPRGLEQDVEAIEGFYGAHGYIGKGSRDRIDVRSIKTPNVERGTMDLVFQISEGDVSYIELVEIKGNIKTKDKVVRRELAVAPGEVFDMVRVKLSVERLNGLTYFSKVGTEVEPTEVPNRKNLVVGVDEAQSGNFYFGAGFSSIQKLFGYVGMTQGNFDLFNPPFFTGGGQKLRLQATVGTEQQNYEIIFTEPWFLNRKLALDVNLFARDIGYYSTLYQQKEIGGTVGLARAIFIDQLRVGMTYTLEQIDLDFGNVTTNVVRTQGPGRGSTSLVVPPGISPTLLQQEGTTTVSKIGNFITYDTRGGGMLPNRGQITTLATSLAGGPLGFDTSFYKVYLNTAWYFKGLFPGHVLEVGGFSGIVQPYGESTYVPIFDQFFLGGANNLRGFQYREVGPKDIYGNPVGGNVTWFTSVEYSVPIMERLRLAVFYDMGNVYATVQDVDFSQFSSDWGFGLRLNIPQMGPLRLDYGIPIKHPDNSGSGRFQFSVGYTRPF
jgi:outer membrane protein insertion porin family